MHEARRVEQTEFCPDSEIHQYDRRTAVWAASAGGGSKVCDDGNETADIHHCAGNGGAGKDGHAEHICNEYHAGYEESNAEGKGKLYFQGHEGRTHSNVLGLPGRSILMKYLGFFYLVWCVHCVESNLHVNLLRERERKHVVQNSMDKICYSSKIGGCLSVGYDM